MLCVIYTAVSYSSTLLLSPARSRKPGAQVQPPLNVGKLSELIQSSNKQPVSPVPAMQLQLSLARPRMLAGPYSHDQLLNSDHAHAIKFSCADESLEQSRGSSQPLNDDLTPSLSIGNVTVLKALHQTRIRRSGIPCPPAWCEDHMLEPGPII